MWAMTRCEYRSLACAGSKPVSADSKRTRSTLASTDRSLVSGAAADTRAPARSPAPPIAKLRRSIPPMPTPSGPRHRRIAVVDVDVVPPLLPERRPPVADHPLLRHVERDAV